MRDKGPTAQQLLDAVNSLLSQHPPPREVDHARFELRGKLFALADIQERVSRVQDLSARADEEDVRKYDALREWFWSFKD